MKSWGSGEDTAGQLLFLSSLVLRRAGVILGDTTTLRVLVFFKEVQTAVLFISCSSSETKVTASIGLLIKTPLISSSLAFFWLILKTDTFFRAKSLKT